MTLTATDVQTAVFNFMQGSDLAKALSGKVYRSGYRPRDSRKEDAVIIFTAGLPGEIQTGVVTLNIYVPDIEVSQDGTFVANGARIAQIERLAQDWVDGLTADRSRYLFELQSTIFTEPAEEVNQHFIVVRLKYKYY